MDSMTLFRHILDMLEMSIVVLGCISLGMIGFILYPVFSEIQISRRIRSMHRTCTRLTSGKGVP